MVPDPVIAARQNPAVNEDEPSVVLDGVSELVDHFAQFGIRGGQEGRKAHFVIIVRSVMPSRDVHGRERVAKMDLRAVIDRAAFRKGVGQGQAGEQNQYTKQKKVFHEGGLSENILARKSGSACGQNHTDHVTLILPQKSNLKSPPESFVPRKPLDFFQVCGKIEKRFVH